MLIKGTIQKEGENYLKHICINYTQILKTNTTRHKLIDLNTVIVGGFNSPFLQ
jgi:hypothetical protein